MSAALLVDVLRTLLNVSMLSHSQVVVSKQFQTTGPLNKDCLYLVLANSVFFFLGTSINFNLRLESVIY